jgi:uncharacterized protein
VGSRNEERQRIAVIGGGVAGLATAWFLQQRHEVRLFEREEVLGGHAHTVAIGDPQGPVAIDTGFVVYNERNYPLLSRLFAELDVPTQATDMSFSYSLQPGGIEYAGTDLNTLFAQRLNLLRPRFLRMVTDVLRFNRLGKRLLAEGRVDEVTLGEFLVGARVRPGLHRGLPAADGRGHLVLPRGDHARIPRARLPRVLPQSRAAGHRGPAAVAHRGRRQPGLRPAAGRTPGPGTVRYAGVEQVFRSGDRWRVATRRDGGLRRGGLRVPRRRRPGHARHADARTGGSARGLPVPAQSRAAAHRYPPDAPNPAGCGRPGTT